MDYLGVILEKGITHMDPIKIAGIKNWPMHQPKLRTSDPFWVFAIFTDHLFEDLHTLHRPLNELT
jgi:hypothetical protein